VNPICAKHMVYKSQIRDGKPVQPYCAMCDAGEPEWVPAKDSLVIVFGGLGVSVSVYIVSSVHEVERVRKAGLNVFPADGVGKELLCRIIKERVQKKIDFHADLVAKHKEIEAQEVGQTGGGPRS